MTSSDTPRPFPSPEDEGLPGHADDDSTAYDESDRPRFDDSPPALPGDRDRTQGVDEPGVTPQEARQGESLTDRLGREAVPGQGGLAGDTAPPGRLVEPDQGAHPDEEQDLLASVSGEAGGGLSAEEAAVHPVPDEDELTGEVPGYGAADRDAPEYGALHYDEVDDGTDRYGVEGAPSEFEAPAHVPSEYEGPPVGEQPDPTGREVPELPEYEVTGSPEEPPTYHDESSS